MILLLAHTMVEYCLKSSLAVSLYKPILKKKLTRKDLILCRAYVTEK